MISQAENESKLNLISFMGNFSRKLSVRKLYLNYYVHEIEFCPRDFFKIDS